MQKEVLKGKMLQLYPTKQQEVVLSQNFGCNRFVYNQMLDMQTKRHKNGGKYVSTFAMNNLLPQLKKEYPWLKEAESSSLQKSNDNLSAAFKNFFEGNTRYPKFKAKSYEQSMTVKNNNNIWIIDEHHIHIAKLGDFYFKSSYIPAGKIQTAKITKKASGRYTVSLLLKTVIEVPEKTGKSAGIDLGLKELATLDDGAKFPLPRFDKALEDKLHYWQRLAARRLVKAKQAMKADETLQLTDFKNYQKARQMVAKYNEKIANQRYDYLQKLSTMVVMQYDVIVVEDLKVKFMLRNHKLARAISNAGWKLLIKMLKYKCEWYNKTFVQVNPKYTSQTCSVCGCNNKRLGYDKYGWLKQREWDCPNCGTHHDRDINAAINIKRSALV